jgi:hypothetical protein
MTRPRPYPPQPLSDDNGDDSWFGIAGYTLLFLGQAPRPPRPTSAAPPPYRRVIRTALKIRRSSLRTFFEKVWNSIPKARRWNAGKPADFFENHLAFFRKVWELSGNKNICIRRWNDWSSPCLSFTSLGLLSNAKALMQNALVCSDGQVQILETIQAGNVCEVKADGVRLPDPDESDHRFKRRESVNNEASQFWRRLPAP